MEKKMGLSYGASSSAQQTAYEGERERRDHNETESIEQTQGSEQQSTYENNESDVYTPEPPEKLLSFDKEKVVENAPLFSVTEDEDWKRVEQYIPKEEPVVNKPDIAMASNVNLTNPLDEKLKDKFKETSKQSEVPQTNKQKAEAKYKPALDEIEKKKQAPVDHSSINSEKQQLAKGFKPNEQSVAKERQRALEQKDNFSWDNVKMDTIEPDKVSQDKVWTYTDPNGNEYTEEEVRDAQSKEEAYLNKRDEAIAKNASNPNLANSIDIETALRAYGLYPNEQSAAKERQRALEQKDNFNWNNVKIEQGPVDQEAVLKQYLDNGVFTENTDILFEENIPLRDRVIELQNEGKTTQQIFSDKKVRDALGLVTNAKLVTLAIDALTTPFSAGLDKFITKKIGQEAMKYGRSIGGLTTSARKAKNAQLATARLEKVMNKRYALNHFRKVAEGTKNAAVAGSVVTGAAAGMVSGIADTVNSTAKKEPSIQYDPSKINNVDADSSLLNTVEGLESIDVPNKTMTLDLSLNLNSDWNDIKTALDGEVTQDNIKSKTDYLRELLDDNYIETMAKAKGLKPNEVDAVYKELYDKVDELEQITNSYTGDYEEAAKQILNNPKDYDIEDRIASRNILDGNAYNGKQDSVFTAGKTLSYIKDKLNNVRIENAFRNRKTDPDTWHNVINEMSENVRKNVLSTTSDGRFLGKDVSNKFSNGMSKAKNSFIEAKNEIVNKVREMTGLDKVLNKLSNTKVGRMYTKAKSAVGTVLSNIVNPLEGVANLMKYGIELPIDVFGTSLIEAGYKTVGDYVGKLNDKIAVARAGLTGNADVNNTGQYEAALATKQGRAVISGMSKIIEGVMSFGGTTGLSSSQIVRGVTEMMIGLDSNIDVKRINNAADQVLDSLGIGTEEQVAPDSVGNDVTSSEDALTKKKKKTVVSDIENDEGTTANAAGFNSGLGADTIKYLYENLLRQNK